MNYTTNGKRVPSFWGKLHKDLNKPAWWQCYGELDPPKKGLPGLMELSVINTIAFDDLSACDCFNSNIPRLVEEVLTTNGGLIDWRR